MNRSRETHVNGRLDPGEVALNNTLRDLRKRFPELTLGPPELMPAEVISTGFPSLNEALGLGGLPRGRIVNIYGPDSSGKTTLCLHVIAEAQKAGGQAVFIDAEHKLDLSWARKRGVDLARLVLTEPDTGEHALEIADGLIHSGAFSVVVIDSTAALLPAAEAEGEMGARHNHHGWLMSQALRKLAGITRRTNTLLIFTSQLRHAVGVMFGSQEAITGGNALRYYASVAIDLRRQQAIKRGGQVVGSRVRAVVKKNQVAAPFRSAEFDILFDE
jgi:recombination protein RecA